MLNRHKGTKFSLISEVLWKDLDKLPTQTYEYHIRQMKKYNLHRRTDMKCAKIFCALDAGMSMEQISDLINLEMRTLSRYVSQYYTSPTIRK